MMADVFQPMSDALYGDYNESSAGFNYGDLFNWTDLETDDPRIILLDTQDWNFVPTSPKPGVDNVTLASSSSWDSSFWEAAKIRIPLYSVIFLLGITGNVLVILTLVQNSRMRTVTNLFLLNLAISDLSLGVFCMPFTLVGALLRDFIFGQVFCKLIPFLQAVSVSVSGWTLVAISIERFYAICHPLTSRRWQTTRHARVVILIVWIISLAIMSPVAILSELKPVGSDGRRKCREVWPEPAWEKMFTVLLDVVLLILPLFVMAVMYGLIVRHLWKVDQGAGEAVPLSSHGGRKSHQETATTTTTMTSSSTTTTATTNLTVYSAHRRSNTTRQMTQPSLRRCNAEHCLKTKRRVLKMLLVVVLEFFICWTPLYVVNTLSYFAPRALYEGLGYTGISLVQLLAQASCCCNPITYCFMSSSFRRAFLRAFGCTKIPSISPSSNVV